MRILNIRKMCAVFTIMFAFLALIFSAGMFVGSLRSSETSGAIDRTPNVNASTFYYDQLVWNNSRLEIAFYNAIKKMWEDGDLKTGTKSIDLVSAGVLTQKDVDTYATNSLELLYAFGGARDAFYLDHPDVFYVNFDKMSVRTLTKTGKNYAFLGTGRADSYLADGADFGTVTDVDNAISALGAKYAEVLTMANAKTYTIDKIKLVYDFVRNNISYKTELDCTPANIDYVRSPYGLVKGEGVCEAYARSFKMIMDELGLPCISVIGMYNEYSEDDSQQITLSEPHMWNYALVDGLWYLIDTTMDSAKADADCEYFLAGYGSTGASHIPDQIISQSNYSFRYPDLCNSEFSATGSANANFVMAEVTVDETPCVKITYKGKNATKLYQEDGMYFVSNMTGNIEDDWAFLSKYVGENLQLNGTDTESGLLIPANVDYKSLRVGVVKANDITNEMSVPFSKVVEYSGIFVNGHQVASTHKPFAVAVSPKSTEVLRSGVTYNITMVFDEVLKAEAGKSVSIEVTHNANVTLDDTKVSAVAWDGQKTVTCKFTTSSKYAANTCSYKLYVKGLVSVATDRECMPVGFFVLNQTNVGCPIKWGQTYEVYGKPQLLETPDIDTNGWQLQNGTEINKNLSNGIALVVNEYITDTVQGAINTGISADLGKTEQSVLASKTYDVSLTLCGQQVKNLGSVSGKRVKIMLPFPEGYSGKEAGVTFKAYHYSTVTNKVEEVDCLINENGVVIFCNEFSPFTIVATQKPEVLVTKKVVVLTHDGGKTDTEYCELQSGESKVITLVPNTNYVVEFVRVNGKDKAVVDSKFSISYEELSKQDSVIEVFFANVNTRQTEEDEGYAILNPTATAPRVTITRYVDTLSAVVTGVVGKLTYQWYMDGKMIVGANKADYQIEMQNDNKVYTVEVTNSVMSSTATAVSEPYQKVQKNTVLIVLLMCVVGALICVALATAVIRQRNAKNKQ